MTSVIARKLRVIQDGGMKGIDVAQVLGTRPETVSRWNQGRNQPQGKTLFKLLELEFIMQRLQELYSPEEARLWIFSRHKALHNEQPAKLILEGRTDDVVRAIDQLADGVYL